MGMTRRERIKRQRDRERDNQITGEGIAVGGVADDFKCDQCGNPKYTLYEVEGRLLCSRDVPYAISRHGMKMIRRAVSGAEELRAKRFEIANGAGH
jgi:hypothetical protein